MAGDEKELHDRGMKVRREVLGAEYVDQATASADAFQQHFQEWVTKHCWGAVWARPGLPRKTRSMLNLAMLAATGRAHELKIHIKGALTNGVTQDEMAEIFLQVGAYCGAPAALESFKVAKEVFAELGR
ncbi:MAG: carboxymuconolactone decarboxylase family protein [Burkholderiales bacterium]|nr:carboxymuconolactone decarboxylase family protein [Burkholderiales bacterium]